MNNQKSRGIWLRAEQTQAPEFDPWLSLCCGTTLYALAHLTGHSHPWIPGAAALLTGCFAAKRWFYPGTLGSMALLLLLFREPILDGFCQWYNAMGDVYTAGRGIVLPELAVAEGSGTAFALFSILSGIGLGTLVCRTCKLPVISAAAVTAASLALGAEPTWVLLPVCGALLCDRRGRAPALAVLGALLLVFRLTAVDGWAQAQSAWLADAVHKSRYETAYTQLPEGRDPDGTLIPGDAPALVVTMEKPERLYLRGFTGAQLLDGRWHPLESAVLAEHEALLYWLNLQEFDIRCQFAAASASMETQTNTVTVQNIGACSAYRYVPFTLRPDEALRPEDLADFAGNDGQRYDVFTTVYRGSVLLPELLTALEEDGDYRRAEAAYREFVKAHYLQIPEDAAISWEAYEGLDAQSAVLATLEAVFPEGAENSPRYATAAVLTLRHFGIPARYAEGYIVPESTEASITVDGSCAACWAEVYQDGIGWIPMALTPGLEETEEQTQDQPQPTEPEETMPQETVPQSEPEPSGGWQVRIGQVLMGCVLLAVLVLLLIIGALLIRRALILKKRRARFEQENTREAIAWIFADCVSLLERMGFRRGNGSLSEWAEPIRAQFGEDFGAAFAVSTALNEKTLFSTKAMTEEERQTALQFREQTLQKLLDGAPWYRRLWMKYILCLD